MAGKQVSVRKSKRFIQLFTIRRTHEKEGRSRLLMDFRITDLESFWVCLVDLSTPVDNGRGWET